MTDLGTQQCLEEITPFTCSIREICVKKFTRSKVMTKSWSDFIVYDIMISSMESN